MSDKAKIIWAIVVFLFGALIIYEIITNTDTSGFILLKNIISGKQQLEGNAQILFYGAILLIIELMFCAGIPLLICLLLIRSVTKGRKQAKEMQTSFSKYRKDRAMHEARQYASKKIVRCEWCNRQARYGTGVCPHCGGKLENPERL